MRKSILQYGDVQLYPSDLLLLEAGEWLNDTVIEFYYEYLERSLNNSEILFLRPCIVYLIIQSKTADLDGIQGVLPTLKTRRLVFMPLNDNQGNKAGGTHWSLLVYDRMTSNYYHYDSAGSSNWIVAKELVKKLKLITGDGSLASARCPQQHNGYDCGVFVIYFTQVLVQHFLSAEPNWTSININCGNSIKEMRPRIKGLINELIQKSSF